MPPLRELPPSDLPENQAAILLRLQDGWWPNVPTFGRPKSLVWAERTYPGSDLTLSLEGGELRGLLLINGDGSSLRSLARLDGRLVVDFDDNTQLIAKRAIVHNAQTSHGEQAPSTRVTFSSLQWQWHRLDGPAPILWLINMGATDPGVNSGTANFQVQYARDGELVGGVSSWQTTMTGTARSFIVQRTIAKHVRAWCVTIVEPVNMERWLEHDWLALKVTIGRRLDAEQILGIDAAGNVAHILGRTEFARRDIRGTQREGIPLNTGRAVAEDFFRSLCSTSGIQDNIKLPAWLYVDTIGDSAAGEYLKIRTAMVMLARSVGDLPPATHRSDLAQLLASTSQELPAGDLATLAEHWEMSLVRSAVGKLLPELAQVADRALSATPAETVSAMKVPAQAFNVVAMYRTLFFGLLGRLCGYTGPILHWELVPGQGYGTFSLGPPEAGSESIFHVTATLPVEASMFDVWPIFEMPRLPDHPTLRALNAFASSLEQRAGGTVRASLQPQARSGPEHRYNFKIVLSRMPNVQTIVFSVVAQNGELAVEGWPESDTPIGLESPYALNRFVTMVAKSETVRNVVEQYMLLDSELSRGEK